MSKKPTVLMILDGYGLNERHDANAVYEANTPVMDKLMAEYPFVKGNASGLAVGLPDGQMGNSEVGHMNMGAGRIVYQELTRITKEIQDGDFFKNEALLAAMKNAKENDSAIHFMGLLSDGGVHSHITHLFGLLEMAKKEGLNKVYVHCFLVTTAGIVLSLLTTHLPRARVLREPTQLRLYRHPMTTARQTNSFFQQSLRKMANQLPLFLIKILLYFSTSVLTVHVRSQEHSAMTNLQVSQERNALTSHMYASQITMTPLEISWLHSTRFSFTTHSASTLQLTT